jgi:cathepsin B
MSDRTCINSSGSIQVRFSAQHIASCCKICGFGCNGGSPLSALKYWVTNGVVSGGDFGSSVGCQPYLIQECRHGNDGLRSPCTVLTTTLKCSCNCTNPSYGVEFIADKRYGNNSYIVPNDVVQIQNDIYTNGPVVAVFEVKEDFFHYKSGVYQFVAGSSVGGHAVKIIGWGSEGGADYWLVANSWNSDWGLNGFFKILRGVDHLGIESKIV